MITKERVSPTQIPINDDSVPLARIHICQSRYIQSFQHRLRIDRLLQRISDIPGIREIILLPSQAVFTQQHHIDGFRINQYTEIGLVGWAAWTVADDLRDGYSRSKSPGDDIALFSILHSIFYDSIRTIRLPRRDRNRCSEMIGLMEYANASSCALKIRERSAWKSMGMVVPLLALMMKAGVPAIDLNACRRYFYHLILARQISDDARDWKDDLGYTADSDSVAGKTIITAWMDDVFEETLVTRAAREILKHANLSIRHAQQITCFESTGFLEKLPIFYVKMAEAILERRATSLLSPV